MLNRDKQMTVPLTIRKNPPYPKVRLICGQFERIKTPDAIPDEIVLRPDFEPENRDNQ